MWTKIKDEFKAAYIAKDTLRVSVYRDLKARIQAAEKGTGSEKAVEITDDVVLDLIRRAIKQNKETIADAEKAELAGLAIELQSQNEILESHLPRQMSEDEIRLAVSDILTEMAKLGGAINIKQFGRVMGAFNKTHGGNADNKLVAEIVKEAIPAFQVGLE